MGGSLHTWWQLHVFYWLLGLNLEIQKEKNNKFQKNKGILNHILPLIKRRFRCGLRYWQFICSMFCMMVPRICRSSWDVVGNSASIWWHSSCNSRAAFLSKLGIGGISPSDHVGRVRAAAMTAPLTKLLSSPLDKWPEIMEKRARH